MRCAFNQERPFNMSKQRFALRKQPLNEIDRKRFLDSLSENFHWRFPYKKKDFYDNKNSLEIISPEKKIFPIEVFIKPKISATSQFFRKRKLL